MLMAAVFVGNSLSNIGRRTLIYVYLMLIDAFGVYFDETFQGVAADFTV